MKTLEWVENKLKLIDQTKLPDELTYVYCETYQEVIVAIKDMIVRGAPAIGVSAAYGLALADLSGEDMEKAAKEMRAARPMITYLKKPIRWLKRTWQCAEPLVNMAPILSTMEILF